MHVLAECLALLLLDHRQVHASARASHGTCKVVGELRLQLVPIVDRVLVKQLEPHECSLVQIKGEVEALVVVVSTSIVDGQVIAPESLNWILLRIVLGDPERFELLEKKQSAKL
jgi:hypothetical protein